MSHSNVVTCEKGWKDLYESIIEIIVDYDKRHFKAEDRIGVESISEVDGGMEVKVINENNLTSGIRDEILIREHESFNICEFCGTKTGVGTTMNNDFKTCCKSCWESNILNKQENSIWKEYSTNKCYKKTENNGK